MTEQEWNSLCDKLIDKSQVKEIISSSKYSAVAITPRQFDQIKKIAKTVFGDAFKIILLLKFEKWAISWENEIQWNEFSIEKNNGKCQLTFATGEY